MLQNWFLTTLNQGFCFEKAIEYDKATHIKRFMHQSSEIEIAISCSANSTSLNTTF